LRKFHLTLLLAITITTALVCSCGLKPAAQIPEYSNTQPDKETSPEVQTPVPSEYQRLYDEIAGKLDAFNGYLNSLPNEKENKITFGAELLPANGHQGDKLLTQENYDGTLLYLDALQSMGVQGVKISIDYPLLAPDFPNSDGYLEYYKNICQELRKRNMTILVAIGNLFPDASFTDLKVSFANLTFDEYRQTKRQIAERIINEIHPDYLTLANEPSTEAMTTGLKVTVPEFTQTVNYILNGLDRKGVLIGAGAGSWNNIDYVKSLARDTDIDYIDIHIYPANYLEQALTMADIAHAGNKRLIIGEAWTYKAYDSELGDSGNIATQADIFGRDVYSFWQPLDSKFMGILVKLANYKDYEFISPFWSKYFFGYLDYETLPENLAYNQLAQLSNQKAVQNIMTHKLTGTGLTYQELIKASEK
jgi:hypothetical protein